MRMFAVALIIAAAPARAQVEGDAPEATSSQATQAADASVSAASVLTADAGAFDAGAVDAGIYVVPVDTTVRVPNHHFSTVEDTDTTPKGRADVQASVTPQWGRIAPYTEVALHAGASQGVLDNFSLGIFLDATTYATGAPSMPSVDTRVTLHAQARLPLGKIGGLAAQLDASPGLNAASFRALLMADVQAGALRVALNVEGWGDARWRDDDGSSDVRLREALGLGYGLGNGFSVNVEMQNHQSWYRGTYLGDAFLIGPAVSWRGQRLWVTAALLAEVAAIKTAAQLGSGDILELADDERYTFRFSIGTVP